MHTTRRIISIFAALLILLPLFAFHTFAAETIQCFIDGENITRGINMAVIYTGVPSTGQSQWGHNIIVSAEGLITGIVAGGDADGENLAVPENGAVISATGTRVQWFKDNAVEGKFVWYDRFTSRLFICNSKAELDPYFTKSISVSGNGGEYLIPSAEYTGIPLFTHTVCVDSDGVVVANGGSAVIPEGGFTVSAATESDRSFLLMYAPVGAKCVINGDNAVFTYDKTMPKRSTTIAIENIKNEYAALKASYANIDYASIDALVQAAEVAQAGAKDYFAASALISSLDEIRALFYEKRQGELRSALYTPVETNDEQVAATVKKAKQAGLNQISLRVTNGYGTFLPLPKDDRFSQADSFGGFDVLKSFTENCKAQNIGLDVCISVFYNEFASVAAPAWLTATNGSKEGISSKFFSPANEEFRDYIAGYARFIAEHYDIGSITLDYVRYPRFSEDCDYGYDDITKKGFAEKYGISGSEVGNIAKQLYASEHWTKWIEYKTSLVNETVKRISEAVREAQSDVYINAFVARDIVDYYYMQDCKTWLDNGWVDGISLSLFDYDEAENDAIPALAYGDGIVTDKSVVYKGYASSRYFYFVGLNTQSSVSARDFAKLIAESRSAGADGFILSSLDSYLAQNYGSYMNVGLLAAPASSPVGDTNAAVISLFELAKEKLTDVVIPGEGCDEATAAQAFAKINDVVSGSAKLDYEAVSELREFMAALFASAPAKNAILSEFDTAKKIALLSKAQVSVDPPPVEESSVPESEPSQPSEAESSESAVSSVSSVSPSGADAGMILVYCFVGIAAAAAIAFLIVALRRRKK